MLLGGQSSNDIVGIDKIRRACLIIKDKVPPPTLNTLMEELIHLLPVMEELIYLLLVDMANAQFRADSNLVYSYFEAAIRAETAKPLMQN